MPPTVPLRRPSTAVPSDAETYVGRPVSSATLAGMADYANHLAGRRARRLTTTLVSSRAGYAGHPGIPFGGSTERVVVIPSSLARNLFVQIDYVADAESSTVPSIVCRLEGFFGTLRDRGVIWTRSDGSLPGHQARIGSIDQYVPQSVHTTTRVQDELATEAVASAPRLLSVPSTARGVIGVLVFTVTQARLLSVSAWELPTVQLP